MGQADFYKHGSWNAICDICGFKFKANQLKRRWDGLMVCRKDFEFRHPQERLRPVTDTQGVPWTRPPPTDVFITIPSYVEDGYVEPIGYFLP